MPTSLLRDVDVLAPFLVELFSRLLLQGAVLTVIKSAYITLLLKKPDLDPAENKSYRPISSCRRLWRDLSLCSPCDVVDVRLTPGSTTTVAPPNVSSGYSNVARQLLDHLYAADLIPDQQSAYSAHNSTEMAILKVLAETL